MSSQAPLQSLISPDLLNLLHTHLLSPTSAVQSIFRQAQSMLSSTLSTLTPLLDAETSSSLIPLLSLSASLAVAFLLIVWIYRMIAFWTRLAMRAVFWGVVFAIAASVYQRGVATCVGEAMVWGGRVMDYGVFVKDIWIKEYERWEAQAEATRAARR